MQYFNQQFLTFFESLEKNNQKEWFEANRVVYENSVKKPFLMLVSHIIEKIAEFDTNLPESPQKAVFRINRDVRFSKDKSPYKTHMAAVFSAKGKNPDIPAYYFMLGAMGLEIGGGVYQPTKEAIEKIRSEIYYQSDEFQKLLNENEFQKKFGTLQGQKNKKLEQPYMDYSLKQPLIANKQFYYWAELKQSEIVSSQNLLELIVSYFKAGSKMNKFLRNAIEV